MTYIDKVFDIILDKQTKLSKKAAILFMIIIGVLFLNDFFNFSSSYVINNNISQIKELNVIIGDTISDFETKKFAIELRKKIIHRKNFFDLSNDYFNEIDWKNIKHQNHPESRGGSIKLGIGNKSKPFWLHLTAGGIFYLLSLLSLLVLFFDKSTSTIVRIGNALLTFIIFFGVGWLCTMMMSLIPIINSDYLFLNYIVNIIIQFLLIYFIIKINDRDW